MEEDDVVVVQEKPAPASESPDKSYYYQLSKCVNCSKSIHKLERLVLSVSTSENNNTDLDLDSNEPGSTTTADSGDPSPVLTFTDLTREIKRVMQSQTTEPFLISALHYTACIEAMRYIYQLSQDDVDHLLQLNSTNEVTLCRACGDLIKNSYNGMRALEKLRDKEANLQLRLSQKHTQYNILASGETGDTSLALPASTSDKDKPLEVVWHVVHENPTTPECQDQETMTDVQTEAPMTEEVHDVPIEKPSLPDRREQETMTEAPEHVMEVEIEQESVLDSVPEKIQCIDKETLTDPLSYLSFPPTRTQQTRIRRYSTEDSRSLTAIQSTGPHPAPLRTDQATLTEPVATTSTEHICWSCGEPSLQTSTAPFVDDKATMTETHVLTPVEDQETMTQTQNEHKTTMTHSMGIDQTTMTTIEAIDTGVDTCDSPWNKAPEPKRARVTKATLMKLSHGLKASVTTKSTVSEEFEFEPKIMNAFTLSAENGASVEVGEKAKAKKKNPIITKKDNFPKDEPFGKRIKLELEAIDIPDENADDASSNPIQPCSSSSCRKDTKEVEGQSTELGNSSEITSPISPMQKLLSMLIKRMSNEMRMMGAQAFLLQELISITRGPMLACKTSAILHRMTSAARNIYTSLDECIITFKVYDSSNMTQNPQNGMSNSIAETEPHSSKATHSVSVDVLAAYFKLLIRMEKCLDTNSNCRFWVTIAMYKHRIIRIMKYFLETVCGTGKVGVGGSVSIESYFMNICYCLSKAVSPEECSDVDVPLFGASVWAQIQGWNHTIDVDAAKMDHRMLGVNGFNQQISKILAAIERAN